LALLVISLLISWFSARLVAEMGDGACARTRAQAALMDAIEWRVKVAGVMKIMLDYVELKAIRFPILRGEGGVWSDGRKASIGMAERECRRKFWARSPDPLSMCVPHWSVRVEGIISSHFVRIGVTGANNPDLTQINDCDGNEWIDLVCLPDLYTDKDPRQDRCSVIVQRGDHRDCNIPIVITRTLQAPFTTFILSADLETEMLTWTAWDGESVSICVGGLKDKYAYVDLTRGSSATITQLPNPWIF
jgi:hypothetical protein